MLLITEKNNTDQWNTLEPNPYSFRNIDNWLKKHQKPMEGVINYSRNNAETLLAI